MAEKNLIRGDTCSVNYGVIAEYYRSGSSSFQPFDDAFNTICGSQSCKTRVLTFLNECNSSTNVSNVELA